MTNFHVAEATRFVIQVNKKIFLTILRDDAIFKFPFFTKINQSLFPVEAAPAWFQAYAAAQTVAHNALTTQITNIVATQTALVAEVANIRTAQTAQAALATTRHETLLIGLYNSRAVHLNGFAVRGDQRPSATERC